MLEIVVAYSNNNSFESVISKINSEKITIYDSTNKYTNSTYKNIVKSDKECKCYKFLTHIIDKYDVLSDYTLFMKDNIRDNVLSIDDYVCSMNLQSTNNLDFYQYNTIWIKEITNNIIHIVNGYNPIFDELVIYKGDTSYIKVNKPNDYKFLENFRRNKPDKFAIRYACNKFNIFLPESYFCPYLASFIASKSAIHRRPREFYVNLRTWLIENQQNWFTLDLMWVLIFQSEQELEYRSQQFLYDNNI
jgi:hypothetical protein